MTDPSYETMGCVRRQLLFCHHSHNLSQLPAFQTKNNGQRCTTINSTVTSKGVVSVVTYCSVYPDNSNKTRRIVEITLQYLCFHDNGIY